LTTQAFPVVSCGIDLRSTLWDLGQKAKGQNPHFPNVNFYMLPICYTLNEAW
jgi:hypothetical protein